MQDAIAIASYYDALTGARQYSPVNVGGNHSLDFETGYTLPVNSLQNRWLSANVAASRIHSVDMMAEAETSSLRSTVNTQRWGGSVGLRYNTPDSRFGINYKSTINVRNLQSTTYSGDNITDRSNRLQLTARLPWQISLNASCNLISRFGYSASTLNKTIALADATISKSLLGDNLTFELRASDIFHQNNKVRVQLNEQGRYETSVRKYLPSYLMLSIRYLFSIAKI